MSTLTDDAAPAAEEPHASTVVEEEPAAAPTTDTPARDASLPEIARWVAALALLGAAVIHFAFAPHHLAEATSHGVFFLVVGWAQLMAAAALAFTWRPQRLWLLGSAAFNVGIVGVWLLSRTSGLPGEAAEAVGFPDSLASALEVVAATAAVAVALGWLIDRPVRRSGLAIGIPVVAMVSIVTASVVPALGGGHPGGAGHDHTEGAAGGDMAGMEGMDHGHGAAAVATTPDDGEQTRIAALTGHLPQSEISRLQAVNAEYLTGIVSRSRALRDLPPAERDARVKEFVDWSVANAITGENGASQGDGAQPTMHSHGPSEWQEMTDPADQAALQRELQISGALIGRFPTAADAMAAGYMQVTPYVPGIGAHYLNVPLLTDDGFDPGHPEMLLYNGNAPTSKLIGLSYGVLGDDAPEGFTGPNDMWHVHPSLCVLGGMVVGPDSTPEDLCASIGARKGTGFEKPMWMTHAWQVPGFESPWGLFSGENPIVNLATSEVGH